MVVMSMMIYGDGGYGGGFIGSGSFNSVGNGHNDGGDHVGDDGSGGGGGDDDWRWCRWCNW